MKEKAFFVLSVILALWVLIILNYKENNLKILPSYRTSSMQGLHLIHKEDNRVKWELTAQDATFPEGNKEIILNSLELKINHNPRIYLTGGNGIYRIEGGNLTINKPIELNMTDTKFTTDTLTWNSENGLITTQDSVKFTGKNFLIEGTGLAVKINRQKVEILKNVKGTFYR